MSRSISGGGKIDLRTRADGAGLMFWYNTNALKAHGLIWRVGKTLRYQLTSQGRPVSTALLAAHSASIEQLTLAA